ncbi:MAG: orotate phosphoribosyltransferase [Rhodothermales bacterium]|nr:orotate phosphoribosyltransferase [Rhodothermales bacterium]
MAQLASLGKHLYERSLVRKDQEPITDPRGQPIGWLLDTRIAMLEGETFRHVGNVLAERLRAKGISQVVGHGFGSYALVGSILSSPEHSDMRGGFLRDRKKPYGRQRIVEGPIDSAKPVALVDDILNSGRSAMKAVSLLRQNGFQVAGLLTLFNFTWSGGRPRLEKEGLWVDSLLDLNLRNGTPPSSADTPPPAAQAEHGK